jgi:hypothetical protein
MFDLTVVARTVVASEAKQPPVIARTVMASEAKPSWDCFVALRLAMTELRNDLTVQ